MNAFIILFFDNKEALKTLPADVVRCSVIRSTSIGKLYAVVIGRVVLRDYVPSRAEVLKVISRTATQGVHSAFAYFSDSDQFLEVVSPMENIHTNTKNAIIHELMADLPPVYTGSLRADPKILIG